MRVVAADDLRRRLPLSVAIDALEAAFRDLDPAAGPLRSRVPTADGELLVMPATGGSGTGVKLVTVTPANPGRGLPFINAVYVLFAAGTQEPVAVIDGAELTAIRTAAVSGLATRHLARGDARRLVIFGAGTQARSHLRAMLAVAPVEEVVVVSPTRARAAAFAEEASELGVRATVGEPSAVRRADLVCTCTTSATPVLGDADVPRGLHINAVGAYQPDARELDSATIARARLVVETREAALAEAGDVLLPIAEGLIDESHVRADLAELVRGARVRESVGDVTVFKSVGIAFEDLVVARAAIREE